jgi:hypothetical protein
MKLSLKRRIRRRSADDRRPQAKAWLPWFIHELHQRMRNIACPARNSDSGMQSLYVEPMGAMKAQSGITSKL